MGYPLHSLGRVLGELGHKVPKEHLQRLMQIQEKLMQKTQERATVKRGRFDQEDLGQYESAGPSVMMGVDD